MKVMLRTSTSPRATVARTEAPFRGTDALVMACLEKGSPGGTDAEQLLGARSCKTRGLDPGRGTAGGIATAGRPTCPGRNRWACTCTEQVLTPRRLSHS
jgi:hypothetical protein